MRDDDEISKGEEISGKMYKYELPLENEPISWKSKSALMLQD